MKSMTGKEKFFWISYSMVLVLLFLLSSTDLIIKEEEAKIHPVSVIVEADSDDNYVNFKKGMDLAAVELNADINFITLYEQGNRKQQEELLLREQQDGSRALIVAPVNREAVIRMQDENRIFLPLVFINSEAGKEDEAEKTATVTFDYAAMGRDMGKEIAAGSQPEEKIYILENKAMSEAGRKFAEGIRSGITESGGSAAAAYTWQPQSGKGNALEEMTKGWTQKIIIAAPEPESLMEAAQLIQETEKGEFWVCGLYGRGGSVPILNLLDKGIIKGLSVTDDFSAGYLSVKAAIELAEGKKAETEKYLDSYYIRQGDLRDEKYEKILYPVE